MILIDEYNKRIKEGDSYYIVTVFDEYHMPIQDYFGTERVIKTKSDLNHFTKIVNKVCPEYSITARKAIYSGSGWGV